MNLNAFKKAFQKPCFTLEEAQCVALNTRPGVLKLQLHQWTVRGEIQRLKRSLYCFPERIFDKTQIVRELYTPAYISLESALSHYGLLPDVSFSMTLVTPKATRNFQTSFGNFIYHTIKSSLFWGFDSETLMGEREKVVLDFFYLNSHSLKSSPAFWESQRWQNLHEVDFEKLKSYASKMKLVKVERLVSSLENYRRKNGNS